MCDVTSIYFICLNVFFGWCVTGTLNFACSLVGSVLLIRRKARVRFDKVQKVFLRRFYLIRFLAKSLRVNKIAMKSFLKNLTEGSCNGQLCMYVRSTSY